MIILFGIKLDTEELRQSILDLYDDDDDLEFMMGYTIDELLDGERKIKEEPFDFLTNSNQTFIGKVLKEYNEDYVTVDDDINSILVTSDYTKYIDLIDDAMKNLDMVEVNMKIYVIDDKRYSGIYGCH